MVIELTIDPVKANLESPTGPKLKRKISAEPTMTVHTRAATAEIYDIFNQPLKSVAAQDKYADSTCESDFDDDDYTSAGESTGTGRISGTSEFGDDETGVKTFEENEENETGVKSVSEWSDFSASKHVPSKDYSGSEELCGGLHGLVTAEEDPVDRDMVYKDEELITPVSPTSGPASTRTRFIPMPPVDYEAPTHPYRDASQASQNRLPFMTPIVEKTESSLAPSTIYQEKDYFNTKTPSRRHGDGTHVIPELDDEIFSPFREIVNDVETGRRKGTYSVMTDEEAKVTARDPGHDAAVYQGAQPQGPIITDGQCNPVDDNIRKTILGHIQPPLSSYHHFFDRTKEISGRSSDIRKFAKAVTKMTKNSSEKTTTNVSMPPILCLEGAERDYVVKRELGKGAFAPVYLVENASATSDDNDDDDTQTSQSSKPNHRSRLEALKMEHPPTAWEFYIMRAAASRLASTRALRSITPAHELHLFADECFLLEQYRDQGTLLSLVNAAKNSPSTSSTTTGVMDEVLAMFFTVELLRTVEALHSAGIMHGDLKADNCLLRLDVVPNSSCPAGQSGDDGEEWSARYHADGSHGWASKGVALIDFGRGIDMRVFKEDVQFVADWKAGPADCVEMREMRPWTWQVDCFGLAGVIHSLLFGKYIETVAVSNHGIGHGLSNGAGNSDADGDVGGLAGLGLDAKKQYKLKEPFKRYWQTELWTAVFDLLLNPARYVEREESGRMPVVTGMRGVREGLEGWLEANAEKRGLRALLRRVEVGCRERRR